MTITRMKAKDGDHKCEIFVSSIVCNKGCDDFRPHFGYWYCVVGGEVAYFVNKRPRSGVQLQGELQEHELDIFNINGSIDTPEYFEELIKL